MKKSKGNSRFSLLRNQEDLLKDNDAMPDRGQHKGTAMVNIPAKDLLWLYENEKCSPRVRAYIKSNLDDLRKEK